MSNFERLRKKIAHINRSAARLETFIDKVNDETSLFELRVRLEQLENIYDIFRSLEIEVTDQGVGDSELAEFDSRYCRMKAKYKQIIEDKLYSANVIIEALNSTRMLQELNASISDNLSSIHRRRFGSALPPSVTRNVMSSNLASNSEQTVLNMLLPTAQVLVRDNLGFYQKCNVLLDSGSQNTLISEKFAQSLGIPRRPSKIFVCGVGNKKAGTTKGAIQLQVKSIHSSEKINMLAHVFKSVTAKLPSSPLTIKYWDEVKRLPLADDCFNTPKDIDILIGYNYFFSLLRDGQISKDGMLLAQNTVFGWVICCGCMLSDSTNVCLVMSQTAQGEDLNQTLRRFWEHEGLMPKSTPLTVEDQRADDLFKATTIRAEKYSVRLPFKDTAALGESYTSAHRRLLAMECKFKTNPELKAAYVSYMQEYIAAGHMELVPESEIHRPTEDMCYLPHYAGEQDSTDHRVVFDGASKTSNGQSFNDNLLRGPILQQDLLAVLLRCRRKKFCFAVDIKQLFRMVAVQQCDRDFQRVLWRVDVTQEVQHYRLTTVTNGTAPAHFLSRRTLLQLCEDEKEEFPLGSEAIKNCFYVDDCMTGSNTLEQAQELAQELNALLLAGGFHLTKWAANATGVLAKIPVGQQIESIVSISQEMSVCLLGFCWNPLSDTFLYEAKERRYHINTKRQLLSEISKIFDPLGFLSPVIVAVKVIMQQLWLLRLDWDETLPEVTKTKAEQLFSELHLLNNINIPRIICSTEPDITYHGFSDASHSAYAAVIYCRKISSDGVISTNIVMAKTRVAPLSMISRNKLELCAAYLQTEIYEYLLSILKINRQQIVCWSGSKTVLAWLAAPPSQWKRFVSHRASYILEMLPAVTWRYVPAQENPADCAARGVSSSYLVDNQLWFRGPSFLQKLSSDWPNSALLEGEKPSTTEEMVSATRLETLQTKAPEEDVLCALIKQVSRWPRLVRALGYSLKACDMFRAKSKGMQPLSAVDLLEAENRLYRYSQALDFAEVVNTIKDGKEPIIHKKLRRLAPFLDEHGVLRVGAGGNGRLGKPDPSHDSLHQIILHQDSPITIKVVRECHLANGHAGVTLLMATLRQRYWIIGGREMAKRVYCLCQFCHRYSNKAIHQPSIELPKFRVNANNPLYEVGCNYAGPIFYKPHGGKQSPLVKAYVAIFMCLVTRAVQLELVTNLGSDGFLKALAAVVVRGGLRAHVQNNETDKGSSQKLGDIYRAVTSFESSNTVSNVPSSPDIEWQFIAPDETQFGGTWETTLKTIKSHLRRTVDLATLNFEQLSTLLTRIEAILNSRPLIQADVDDFSFISPSHFLKVRPLNDVPVAGVSCLRTLALSKWRLIQQLTQHFWLRWSSEYLLSLQPKSNWLNGTSDLCVDDVVTLREENAQTACWKLGIVTEIHMGSDDLVHAATIKTENSTFRRSITKLFPLPEDI